MRLLVGMGRQAGRVGAVWVLDLSDPLAVLGVEDVPQDREEPRPQVRALLEAVLIGPRPSERVLHEIIGKVPVADQRVRKGSKRGDGCEQILAECRLAGHWTTSSLSPSDKVEQAVGYGQVMVGGV